MEREKSKVVKAMLYDRVSIVDLMIDLSFIKRAKKNKESKIRANGGCLGSGRR